MLRESLKGWGEEDILKLAEMLFLYGVGISPRLTGWTAAEWVDHTDKNFSGLDVAALFNEFLELPLEDVPRALTLSYVTQGGWAEQRAQSIKNVARRAVCKLRLDIGR